MNERIKHKEWEHPFEIDPFAMVYTAFRNQWPEARCRVIWDGDIAEEDGEPVWGATTFGDGDHPTEVRINPSLEVWDAVEVLAHELAHVAAGSEANHGPEWEKAFDAIHDRYERITQAAFPDAIKQTKAGKKEGNT